MSTIGVSTRSSHMNFCESSSKVTSERKLRSKKIITTNKNLQNINISTKDKSLYISKTNISANNSQPVSRRLRPRRNKKNYCEDSKLLQQYIPLKQQDSLVIVEKLNLKNKKIPVYKTIKSFEESVGNKNDIYDFMFDINDTIEKTTKKKQKKKINKKKVKTTKKTIRKKVIIQSEIINNEENKSSEPNTNPVKPMQNNPSDSVIDLIGIESTEKDKEIEVPGTDTNVQIMEQSVKEDTMNKVASSNINTYIQVVRESVEENKEKKMPKIISVENADNITVIKSSPNIEEPFRPKNIFDNKTSVKRQNNTLNCSLLTKSLSPILKTSTLDLGSPWRPPTLPMFSRSKHFIQSTPKLRFENNKENMEMNKENMKVNKENMEANKKNKCGREKERKKKTTFHKKDNIIQRELPTNQTSENAQAIDTNKHVVSAEHAAVPARISLGEIKNLLQTKPDNNDDNKQASNQAHVEDDKSLTEKQTDKNLVNFLNFSDTFDVLSETEKLSNFGTEVPLFMDLEPSHFSKVFTLFKV